MVRRHAHLARARSADRLSRRVYRQRDECRIGHPSRGQRCRNHRSRCNKLVNR
jgi:hypothetical protein